MSQDKSTGLIDNDYRKYLSTKNAFEEHPEIELNTNISSLMGYNEWFKASQILENNTKLYALRVDNAYFEVMKIINNCQKIFNDGDEIYDNINKKLKSSGKSGYPRTLILNENITTSEFDHNNNLEFLGLMINIPNPSHSKHLSIVTRDLDKNLNILFRPDCYEFNEFNSINESLEMTMKSKKCLISSIKRNFLVDSKNAHFLLNEDIHRIIERAQININRFELSLNLEDEILHQKLRSPINLLPFRDDAIDHITHFQLPGHILEDDKITEDNLKIASVSDKSNAATLDCAEDCSTFESDTEDIVINVKQFKSNFNLLKKKRATTNSISTKVKIEDNFKVIVSSKYAKAIIKRIRFKTHFEANSSANSLIVQPGNSSKTRTLDSQHFKQMNKFNISAVINEAINSNDLAQNSADRKVKCSKIIDKCQKDGLSKALSFVFILIFLNDSQKYKIVSDDNDSKSLILKEDI